MILLANPERRGGEEEGVDLMPFAAQEVDHCESGALLLRILVEDAAAVLRSYIAAYSVSLCRIVNLEEYLAERFITHLRIVIFHEDSLYMMGLVVTHLGVGGGNAPPHRYNPPRSASHPESFPVHAERPRNILRRKSLLNSPSHTDRARSASIVR